MSAAERAIALSAAHYSPGYEHAVRQAMILEKVRAYGLSQGLPPVQVEGAIGAWLWWRRVSTWPLNEDDLYAVMRARADGESETWLPPGLRA